MAYNLKRKRYSEKYNKTSSVPSPSQRLSGFPGRGVSVSQSRAVTVTTLRFFLWFPLCHLPHVGYSPCDHIVAAHLQEQTARLRCLHGVFSFLRSSASQVVCHPLLGNRGPCVVNLLNNRCLVAFILWRQTVLTH